MSAFNRWFVVFGALFLFACGGSQAASVPNVAPVYAPLPEKDDMNWDDEDEDAEPAEAKASEAESDADDEEDEDDAKPAEATPAASGSGS